MKKGIKTAKLWELFRKRGKAGLTCYDSVKYAGYHRLSAFVHVMKGAGYNIQSQWEKDRDGNSYKRYWLEEASNDPEYGQKKSATTDQSNSANPKKTKK